jgi:HSP20 family molecular chaperone IbpA
MSSTRFGPTPDKVGREYWDYWDYPQTIFKQKFGSVMDEDNVKSASPFSSSLFTDRDALRRDFFSRTSSTLPPDFKSAFTSDFRSDFKSDFDNTGTSTVKNDVSQFTIFLDVSQFRAEEVDVKTVGNEVVIHAKHDDRSDDHGVVSREFTRRYILPLGVDPEKVVCFYDSKGILAVKASKDVPEKNGKETLIRVEKNEKIESNGRVEKKSEMFSETRTSSSASSTSSSSTAKTAKTFNAPSSSSSSTTRTRNVPTSYYEPSTSRISPSLSASAAPKSSPSKGQVLQTEV